MNIIYCTLIRQDTTGVRATIKNALAWKPPYVIKFDELVILLKLKKRLKNRLSLLAL